ncbi:MAG: hypothetical protein PHC51_09190 [bacterium]|nr:hypothetical protein [bacterium]
MSNEIKIAPEPDKREKQFDPKPNLPPYTHFNLAMAAAGELDADQFHNVIKRHGWGASSLQMAWKAGHNFESVRLQMQNLPTVIYAGSKELARSAPESKPIQEFMLYFGTACALLGVSGVAGAGEGAMSMGQEGHGMGIQRLRKYRVKRYQALFPKTGVAGVQLAIEEERPNPYVTPDWLVKPTRDLNLRKARLFSLGIPLLVVYFEGGDATLDEFTYWKTLTKEGLYQQIDTPFSFVRPRAVFVDGDEDNSPWQALLEGYRAFSVRGHNGRTLRKNSEYEELLRGLVKVGDPLAAVKTSIQILDEVAEPIYGDSLVHAWEERNKESFWEVLQLLVSQDDR